MVVYSNIHDKFASTNLTCNLKNLRKKQKKIDITQMFSKKKNNNNIFPIEMVEDACPLTGAGQNHPFPLLPPCPTWRSCKSSTCGAPVRLATKKLLVSVDTVVGLEFLATTLADKHMATVLPNCVLVRRSQRLESLVTDITGVNPLSLLCFVPPH